MPANVDNLTIVPAVADLIGADLEFGQQERREFMLRDALDQGCDADIIFIDCPPGLALLTLNALVAADAVLVPLQAEFFALEGISQLMRSVDMVKRSLNPKLTIEGIVLTMTDKRNNLSEQVSGDVRTYFRDKVFETAIPRNIRITEAPATGFQSCFMISAQPGRRLTSPWQRNFCAGRVDERNLHEREGASQTPGPGIGGIAG